MDEALWIAGAGLAGTLLALDLERRGVAFRIWDVDAGRWSSRVAAGIFNPLLGPRMTPDTGGWDRLEPFYRELEHRLGAKFFHPLDIVRPLEGSKVTAEDFPRSGAGWEAHVDQDSVLIRGGGWVNLPVLLDAARSRWKRLGCLVEEPLTPQNATGRNVVWCGGPDDFQNEPWKDEPLVHGRWQGVRGDVLTIEAPECRRQSIHIGARFLLPLGGGRFRWGATHESDDLSKEERPQVRDALVHELEQFGPGPFRVLDHVWGIRPCSRDGKPLIGGHSREPGWTLFNGFAGKGVSAIPRHLPLATP